jgi:hypothetical protein
MGIFARSFWGFLLDEIQLYAASMSETAVVKFVGVGDAMSAAYNFPVT